jgi:serine/threonine-protein kinase 24/25/MST4
MREVSLVDPSNKQVVPRFTLERCLYSSEINGHFVELLKDSETGLLVVLKRIKKRGKADLRAAVNREVAIPQQLNHHKNIVDFYSWTETPDEFLILMEFVAQPEYFSLHLEVLNQPLYLQPGGDIGRLRSFSYDLFRGLEHMHLAKIIHLDIKPANLLLQDTTREFPVLKLCDFGLSQFLDSDGRVRLVSRCGTEPFIAPEVRSGAYVTPACDIWSAAVFLHKLAVGYTPHSLRDWHPGTAITYSDRYWKAYQASGLPDLLSQCLSKEPEGRPSASEALGHSFFNYNF